MPIFPIRAFFAAILISAAAVSAEAASSSPPATFKLANGLQVVVIEDHRAPVVTHMVWYRCGAAGCEEAEDGLLGLLLRPHRARSH